MLIAYLSINLLCFRMYQHFIINVVKRPYILYIPQMD